MMTWQFGRDRQVLISMILTESDHASIHEKRNSSFTKVVWELIKLPLPSSNRHSTFACYRTSIFYLRTCLHHMFFVWLSIAAQSML